MDDTTHCFSVSRFSLCLTPLIPRRCIHYDVRDISSLVGTRVPGSPTLIIGNPTRHHSRRGTRQGVKSRGGDGRTDSDPCAYRHASRDRMVIPTVSPPIAVVVIVPVLLPVLAGVRPVILAVFA